MLRVHSMGEWRSLVILRRLMTLQMIVRTSRGAMCRRGCFLSTKGGQRQIFVLIMATMNRCLILFHCQCRGLRWLPLDKSVSGFFSSLILLESYSLPTAAEVVGSFLICKWSPANDIVIVSYFLRWFLSRRRTAD